MSDERARDDGTEGVPERGLGLGREGHGGVLLPDGHGERGESGKREEGGKRAGRRTGRGPGPHEDEDRPEEAPDR